jgi:hypothetical protein
MNDQFWIEVIRATLGTVVAGIATLAGYRALVPRLDALERKVTLIAEHLGVQLEQKADRKDVDELRERVAIAETNK